MDFFNLFLLAIGLSMDATAVSMAKGMCTGGSSILKSAIVYSLSFGFFQGVMPVLGYLLASNFSSFIQNIDHWIAFVLLGVIGLTMIFEKPKEADCQPITFKNVIILSIATSIDALAVGVSFAFLSVNILHASLLIGIITTVLSFIGVYVGAKVGGKLERYAGILGGIILIFIGTKTLIEHLFF